MAKSIKHSYTANSFTNICTYIYFVLCKSEYFKLIIGPKYKLLEIYISFSVYDRATSSQLD